MPSDWLQRLDDLEALLRRARTNAEDLERQFETFGAELERRTAMPAERAQRLLRPMLLELLVRVVS
jgi:hypothetical protein